MELAADDPLAVAVVQTVQAGDTEGLHRLLIEHPGLARAVISRVGGPSAGGRSMLHIATDWPGHHPNNAAVVRMLVEHGADVHARFVGAHTETPLHWAASSDDVDVIDVLLDAGADIDATGAVIAGGSPIADATAFGQWRAARRLVERGAGTNLYESAAMGLLDRVEAAWRASAPPSSDDVTAAFWGACAGGQLATARFLATRGADVNRASAWDGRTPLQAARQSRDDDLSREPDHRADDRQFGEVVAWLESLVAA